MKMVGFMREDPQELTLEWEEFERWEQESSRLLQDIENMERKQQKKGKKEKKLVKAIATYTAMLCFAVVLFFTENIIKSVATATAVYAMRMLFVSVRRLFGGS